MKNISLLMFCTVLLVFATQNINAQGQENKLKKTSYLDVDDEPVVFKFEPNFLLKNEQRKAEIAHTRKMIDTLQISDRKRLRLLKDLRKNGMSKRLKKALLVETKFDDIEK